MILQQSVLRQSIFMYFLTKELFLKEVYQYRYETWQNIQFNITYQSAIIHLCYVSKLKISIV